MPHTLSSLDPDIPLLNHLGSSKDSGTGSNKKRPRDSDLMKNEQQKSKRLRRNEHGSLEMDEIPEEGDVENSFEGIKFERPP
jgi:hypothetical protein